MKPTKKETETNFSEQRNLKSIIVLSIEILIVIIVPSVSRP